MTVLAYHIVWTTYGAWLPGDARGWIKKKTLGTQNPDPKLEDETRLRMAGDAVLLDPEQRTLIENTIREHCCIRRWTLHAVNARTNHVHVVVTADRSADVVMEQFKSWCSRKLSDCAGLKKLSPERRAGSAGLPKEAARN